MKKFVLGLIVSSMLVGSTSAQTPTQDPKAQVQAFVAKEFPSFKEVKADDDAGTFNALDTTIHSGGPNSKFIVAKSDTNQVFVRRAKSGQGVGIEKFDPAVKVFFTYYGPTGAPTGQTVELPALKVGAGARFAGPQTHDGIITVVKAPAK